MPKRCCSAGFLTWVQVFSGGGATWCRWSRIHHSRTHGHMDIVYDRQKTTVRGSIYIYSGTDALCRSSVYLQLVSANAFLGGPRVLF